MLDFGIKVHFCRSEKMRFCIRCAAVTFLVSSWFYAFIVGLHYLHIPYQLQIVLLLYIGKWSIIQSVGLYLYKNLVHMFFSENTNIPGN
jgi:hypothetical protein